MAHDRLGGVTNDVGYIGRSLAVSLHKNKPTVSKVRRTLKGIMSVTETGLAIDDPHLPESSKNERLKSPSEYHSSLDLFIDEFEAPSVFSTSGWVQRDLTGDEFLTALDIPSSTITWAKKTGVYKRGDHGGLLGSSPIKNLQQIGDMLYGSRRTENLSAPTNTPTGEPPYILHSQIAGLEEIYNEINQAKVAKNDEAEVDPTIWNEVICRRPSDWQTDWLIVGAEHNHNYEIKYFDNLRQLQHRRFVSNVENSYYKYMHEAYDTDSKYNKSDSLMVDLWEWERDKEAGMEAIAKARYSSFWEWDEGSYPFFWMWQPEVHKDLRDGTKLWIQGELPSNTGLKQKILKEKNIFSKILEKILKIRNRGYIGPSWVRSLTSFFHVPKGEDDIRLVYDLTASGLNDALWVPNFWMPSVGNVLDC